MKRGAGALILIGMAASICVALFQNCGGGFEPTGVLNAAGGFSQEAPPNGLIPEATATPGASPTPVVNATPVATATPSSTATPTATPLPTPVPTATPAAGATLLKTRFYFGGNNVIDAMELDHKTGMFTNLPSTSVATNVGWLAYDATSQLVVAAGSATNTPLLGFAPATGALTLKRTVSFLDNIVHLTMIPFTGGSMLLGANYGAGTLGAKFLSADQTTIVPVNSISFGGSAKAHSSAYDASRQLLFVATLGTNKINVFKVAQTGLTAFGEIAVAAPRTVIFDAGLDKLYVSTESYDGPSYIKGYAITSTNGSLGVSEVASQAMSLSGADIKINHRYRYVMATSREAGKQAVNGMPITTTGILDTTRTGFTIPMTQSKPRSLEVTEDGAFVVVAMDSAATQSVLAWKMAFDASLQYTGATKVLETKLSNTGYSGALSIPLYGN